MQSKETYKLLRQTVGPWFWSNGFASVKSSFLIYTRPAPRGAFTVKFRCSTYGWDKHRGSSFHVWLRHDSSESIDDSATYQLANYLSIDELEFLRARQNKVIATIPQPSPEYLTTMVAGFERTFRDARPMIEVYLSAWRLLDRPYSRSDHVDFRYYTEHDVRNWGVLLMNYIQSIYQREAGAA